MNDNHKLALYVSYYLARFDKLAYSNLGLGNQTQTHKTIGEILSVKPKSVQNWRDEFDPLFGNRVGWYQRPMIPSRIQVANALNALSEYQILNLVQEILKEGSATNTELKQLIKIISDEKDEPTGQIILRGPTGKKAEEFFIDYFEKNRLPLTGEIEDCRELGVGYDFKIINSTNYALVEVKGISANKGGVLFTNKEWEVALSEKERFFLCVVSNLDSSPAIQFINNPAEKLNPQKNIQTTIQINWNISQKQLFVNND